MFIYFPMDDPMMFPVDFPHFLVYSIHLGDCIDSWGGWLYRWGDAAIRAVQLWVMLEAPPRGFNSSSCGLFVIG